MIKTIWNLFWTIPLLITVYLSRIFTFLITEDYKNKIGEKISEKINSNY